MALPGIAHKYMTPSARPQVLLLHDKAWAEQNKDKNARLWTCGEGR